MTDLPGTAWAFIIIAAFSVMMVGIAIDKLEKITWAFLACLFAGGAYAMAANNPPVLVQAVVFVGGISAGIGVIVFGQLITTQMMERKKHVQAPPVRSHTLV